jgi:hypothetical protein
MLPDHSTIAAVVASMQEEITSIVGDRLRIGAEQHLLGGTHVSVDG